MCRKQVILFLLPLLSAGANRPPEFHAAEINDANQPAPLLPHTANSAVARAGILLGRAHFSCGQIDGHYGSNLLKAVRAWQAAHGQPATGIIDDATWAGLNADKAPALISYTISPDDVTGPFVPSIPRDLMEQAQLPALGYRSPLEALAEKFHCSPELLTALNPGRAFDEAAEQIAVPNVIVPVPGKAASVIVSRGDSSVRAYDADGKLLAYYVATIGSRHDPLPIGNWTIGAIQKDPAFHYNAALFWDAHNPQERALIKPGPNNPVGVVWMDLSKDHYGIHGTPEPSQVGHTASHGCIRLTNWDAMELASMVKPGTPALLQE
jgi:lipoprotein-anchoring transpeptidase ErfK/SrfK